MHPCFVLQLHDMSEGTSQAPPPEGSEHSCDHAGQTRDASLQSRSRAATLASAAPLVFGHPANLLHPDEKR